MMKKSGREMKCAGRVLAEVSELASAHRHTLTGLRRLLPPRGAGWEPGDTLRSIRRAKKSHLVGAVAVREWELAVD
jgi:hypothetical protein